MERDVEIGFPIFADLYLPRACIDKLEQVSICVFANYKRDRPTGGARTNSGRSGKVAGVHITDDGD